MRNFFASLRRSHQHEVPGDETKTERGESQHTNAQINQILRAEAKQDERATKLLLVGGGESGKSTFLKCLNYVYVHNRGNYPIRDLELARPAILTNIVELAFQSIKQSDIFGYEQSPECKEFMEVFHDYHTETTVELTPDTQKLILQIFKSDSIRETFTRSNEWEVPLPDFFQYFLTHADRILDPEYNITFEDLIHARQRTAGISQNRIKCEPKGLKRPRQYDISDIGGQRIERLKWVYVFEGVELVIYVCAISGYNQVVFENNGVNRLEESLDLFGSTMSKPILCSKNVLVLLNKEDLFRKKIQEIPFNRSGHFDDYDGDQHDGDEVIEYIKKRLQNMNKNRKREIHFQLASCIDPDSVEKAWEEIMRFLITLYIRRTGLTR